jgi:hypothetical protein
MFNAILFVAVSLVTIGVVEEGVVPVAKATAAYTVEAVDWAKDKVTGTGE